MKKYLIGILALFCIQVCLAQTTEQRQVFSHLVAASGNVTMARPDLQSISNESVMATAQNTKDKLAILMAPFVVRHYEPELSEDKMMKKSIFLMYMAGYNPKDQVLSTYRKAYESVGRPGGFPSLEKMESIVKSVDKDMKKLSPVYDMAVYLSLIGKYDLASKCYEYVLKTFPSREVYNNLAVAHAMDALNFAAPEDVLFRFPFELDRNSRLKDAGKDAKSLMRKAKGYFKTALLLDTAYATGYVNYASASCFLKEYDEAIYYARKGFSRATNEQSLTRSNAKMVEAIAWHYKGDIAKSKGLFQKAEELAGLDRTSLAKINRQIAETGQQPRDPSNPEIINGNVIESLEDLDMEGASTQFKTTIVDDSDYRIVKLGDDIISRYPMEHSHVLVYFTPKDNGEFDVYGLHVSAPNVEEGTARGIEKEHFITDVTEKYGKALLIRSSRQGKLVYYPSSEIIFFFDPYDEVSAWGIVNECVGCRE